MPAELERLLAVLCPHGRVVSCDPLGEDVASGETTKGTGYGRPLRVVLREADGSRRALVFHTAREDAFGHDRRADRAAAMLLAYDTFDRVPGHVRAVDVGTIARDGTLISLRDGGEFYLVSEYATGRPYAEDLRRIATAGHADDADLARAGALVGSLARLHALPGTRPEAYTRAIRDLLGSGEGIFGIVDGYPADVPGAPPRRLQGIERRCLEWRWRLAPRTDRLRRTHGDFHPFNVLFDEAGGVVLLDTSRGSEGDPADDVAAMAINYPFFALDHPGSWARGLGVLWRHFFAAYERETGDRDLAEVIAPFLAWRGLVLCNPRWYPKLDPAHRDRLLGFVERTLDAPRFDPRLAEEVFR